MIEADWIRAKTLFFAALALSDAEREGFLNAQKDSLDVIAEVRSLLKHYIDSPDFLEGVSAVSPDCKGQHTLLFAAAEPLALKLLDIHLYICEEEKLLRITWRGRLAAKAGKNGHKIS